MEKSVYLGRQPIYGPDREIRAYELLYRRSLGDEVALVGDANQATADVLLKAIIEIGLHKVARERPVFINHTRDLLEMQPILPADRCVIEVLEDVAAVPATVDALRRLKAAEYRIALDDFVHRPDLAPMLELADYVKLDYRALGANGFRQQMELVRRYPAAIVAEKIESEAEYRWCKAAGCALFQGYYLRKPELLVGRRIPSNKLSVLSLVAECANLENSADVIAGAITRDATLTYGLLRLANSALYRRRSEIRSPAQAVTMLGMDFVLRWAILLALAGNDDCPTGYLETALQRARMCELLAARYRCAATDAYITGLLSTLDAVLDAPLEDLVGPLPIDTRYKRALLEREGVLGAVLDTVTAYEGAMATDAAIQQAFWEAAEYSRSMVGQIRAGAPAPSAPARDASARERRPSPASPRG
jgi:EAL and modified HD-GYP domain-containing signal transduction protein